MQDSYLNRILDEFRQDVKFAVQRYGATGEKRFLNLAKEGVERTIKEIETNDKESRDIDEFYQQLNGMKDKLDELLK